MKYVSIRNQKKKFIDLIGIIVFFAVNVMLFFVLIKPYFINSCINETNYVIRLVFSIYVVIKKGVVL